MKSWLKFLIVPFLSLLTIHFLFYAVNIPYSSDSWLSITVITLQFLSVIIVPFSMLRFAPLHPYIATTCYMSLLWTFMYTSHIYLNSSAFLQQGLSVIWSGVFWSIAAVSIHCFSFDTHFQPNTLKHTTDPSSTHK